MNQKIKDYISLARPDNWFKNIFVLPGILIAPFFFEIDFSISVFIDILITIIACCLTASSNYVVNEILDAETDRHHPVKKNRPLAAGTISKKVAWIEWIALGIIGVGMSLMVNKYVFYSNLALWIMGCVYNIPPIRSKEIPFIDVLSESVNNPIRLVMGWYATGLTVMPPITAVFAYWMLGAFLMAVKRIAEFKKIGDPEKAGQYRSTFKFYTAERLISSSVFYLTLLIMSAMAFVMIYRLELVFAVPVFALLLSYYLHIGFKPNSPVQYPERLYKEKRLMICVAIFIIHCFLLLFFVDLPWFEKMFNVLTPMRP